MHHGARRKLADVLTAIRLGRRVDDLGRAALANAESRLRSEAEMRRIFAGHEEAVDRAGRAGQNLRFSLDELRYEYPRKSRNDETPTARLAPAGPRGAGWRYPAGASAKVQRHAGA